LSSAPTPWTDDSGVSHQRQCTLTEFVLKGIGDAAPQWNDEQDRSEATVVFTVQPLGWVSDWHENPALRWIVDPLPSLAACRPVSPTST